jgi:hypothetical protein
MHAGELEFSHCLSHVFDLFFFNVAILRSCRSSKGAYEGAEPEESEEDSEEESEMEAPKTKSRFSAAKPSARASKTANEATDDPRCRAPESARLFSVMFPEE